MMRLLFLVLALGTAATLQAQDRRCAFAPPTDQQAFEHWISEVMSRPQRVDDEADSLIKLPVVVHIIHDGSAVGEGLNLSREQIISQINATNADFQRRNADSLNAPANFRAVAANLGIALVLAVEDPSGNSLAEPGIHRVRHSDRGWVAPPFSIDYFNTVIKPSTIWPPTKYLNIWVSDLDGFLGQSPFPISPFADLPPAPAADTDGPVIDYQNFGTIGDLKPDYSLGRTLTHELGHWLGLYHPWGNGGCGSTDYCDDTPQQNAEIYNCPTLSNTCGSADMFQNFMSYTNDDCMNLFTHDQKARVMAVLQAAPRRKELLKSDVLTSLTKKQLPQKLELKVDGEKVFIANVLTKYAININAITLEGKEHQIHPKTQDGMWYFEIPEHLKSRWLMIRINNGERNGIFKLWWL